MTFHDELLLSTGSRWDDWRSFPLDAWTPVRRKKAAELFENRFGGSRLVVVKDPRMCRFVPAWIDILTDLSVTAVAVLPVRSPLEVAISLQRRDRLSLSSGMLVWLRHILDAERDTRNLRRSIVNWPDFLLDWRAVIDRVTHETGIVWPRRIEDVGGDIDSFLSLDLRHWSISPAETRAHPEVHPWVATAYEAMLALAHDPHAAEAMRILDDLRRSLQECTGLFESMRDGERQALDDEDRNEARRLRTALATARADMRQSWTKVARTTADLKAAKAELAAAQAELRELRWNRAPTHARGKLPGNA